jgi:hypothetical protein
MTVLEAQLQPGQEIALQNAYQAAADGPLPAGFVRSELLCTAREPSRWRIQTWWVSAAALEAMRGAGTPAGVLMFHAANAEPALSIFDVIDAIPGDPT